MARPLSLGDSSVASVRDERRSARTAARAFAAALSVLLVTTLVIDRSSSAIRPSEAEVSNSFEAGTIQLTDDDAGRSLFDLSDMAPGRPAVRCIDIRYGGTITPVDLYLTAEVAGDLAPYMGVLVERGTGGSFDSCDGFEARATVFEGTLAGLAQVSRAAPVPVAELVGAGQAVAYRFRFELADDDDVPGKLATASFVWEALPS